VETFNMPDSPSRAWFALGTFSMAGGKPFAGLVLSGERVVPVDTLGGLAVHAGCALDTAACVLELLENWERNKAALQGVADALAAGRACHRWRRWRWMRSPCILPWPHASC
jgi:hypothetical protein